MIQLKNLDKGLTEVLDDELGSVVGGLFGGTYFPNLPTTTISLPKPEPTPNQYNTPSILPTLPGPGSYTPDQAVKNLGVSASDGKGNIIEGGPGRFSYDNNGNGVGVQFNQDSVGVFGKATY